MLGLGVLFLFGMAASAVAVFEWGTEEEEATEEEDFDENAARMGLELDDPDFGNSNAQPSSSENSIIPIDLTTYTMENDSFDSIEGSEPDERIELGEGHHIVSVRGGGADTVDAGDADTALIFFGGGDLVLGPDKAEGISDFVAVAVEGGELQGGAGDEFAQAIGDGATLSGNAGNDMLLSDKGTSTLIGGEGNDTLVGGITEASYHSSDADASFQTDDRAEDYLSGGDGDDLLRFSTGDIVEGGGGADRFEMEFNAIGENFAAVVQDFNKIDDSLVIEMRVDFQSLMAVRSASELAGSNGIEVCETDEGTDLLWNNRSICSLTNAIDVSAHVTIDMPDGKILHLHWQDGAFNEEQDEPDADVEIFISAIL